MSNKSKNKYPMVYKIIVFYQSNFALLNFSAFLDRNRKHKLMTKCQIYVCVLVLFIYMIFLILMTLNNIVLFLNVEPKTARPAIF